ncbi:MAG: type II secretion system protein [Patescibacteria group bacterium]
MSKSILRGFTLIEILIVISIVGIFTAVVFGSITASRSKARDNSRIADMKTIELALALYYDVNREYPDDPSVLVAIGQKYLPELPVDPKTQEEYSYNLVSGTNKTKYCLGAKIEGTIPNDSVTSCGQSTLYWASR